MTVDIEQLSDLTFKARALAQAHPLTPAAYEYRRNVMAVERREQPLSEFADWASTAFLVGYCVRRVEEAERDSIPANVPSDPDPQTLGRVAAEISERIRAGLSADPELLAPPVVEAMLNKVIGTEIDKRSEHWKAKITTEDWDQFEQYVAWWVIHGYALRAAETLVEPT